MTAVRWATLVFLTVIPWSVRSQGAERYHSDGDARFLHHIDLYDIDNRKITAESTRPYSPMNTCGRCHDYDTIAHGWHFNAFADGSVDGRGGEPWIWTDAKTGTQLPLSYRDWSHTYDPRTLGITAWEMTLQFGGRTPGGNMGQAPNNAGDDTSQADSTADDSAANDSAADDSTAENSTPSRWPLSGQLVVDCMVCHAVSGAYDFNLRRDQIAEENFAWAPTAGIRLGVIDGRVSKIKQGADPDDESTKEKIPTVAYDARRFGPDGTVFMDLIRKPSSNACYQCHSNRTVGDDGIDARWIHDQDVHLRAGMECVDCHRNGIDHNIVRGFEREQYPTPDGDSPNHSGGHMVETLTCAGCHMGTAGVHAEEVPASIYARPGRLGSPMPAHAGLPPLHFEKLSCTACHGGPVPREEAVRLMTSLAHGLGEQGHRTGAELPAIVGPVYAKGTDARVYPHRSMWPAFWGTLVDGRVQPLPPSQVYDATRRALRVRKDFVEEVLRPKLGSSDMKEILGEDRARTKPEEWTAEEAEAVAAAQAEKGRELFAEKVYGALEAIEKEVDSQQAVYVSSGTVYAKGDEEDSLTTIEVADDDPAVKMLSWPLAHNVRPAGWSLGVGGCTDCHRDDAEIFASTVAALGPGPDDGDPVTMASLQGISTNQRLTWNEMFRGRASFKYIVASSVALLVITLCIGIGALASRFAGRAA